MIVILQLIDYGYVWLNDYVTYTTINDRSQDWADIINRIQDEEKNQDCTYLPYYSHIPD